MNWILRKCVEWCLKRKILQPKIYLEGTACVGKTSAAKWFKEFGMESDIGDYAEHCKKHPMWRDKDKSIYLASMYGLKVALQSVKPGIQDRTPFASLVYTFLFDNLANASGDADYWAMVADDFSLTNYIEVEMVRELLKPNAFVYIFTAKHPDDIVNRMIVRNNGIDLKTNEYVWAQNALFLKLAWELKHHYDIDNVRLIRLGNDEFVKDYIDCILNDVKKYYTC